jgi:hypothetical protein
MVHHKRIILLGTEHFKRERFAYNIPSVLVVTFASSLDFRWAHAVQRQ